VAVRETSNQAGVPNFPGMYYPGEGKAGEKECFYLPIITKSQQERGLLLVISVRI
jgi:hypothetical protein